jgi:hypothetical protein
LLHSAASWTSKLEAQISPNFYLWKKEKGKEEGGEGGEKEKGKEKEGGAKEKRRRMRGR